METSGLVCGSCGYIDNDPNNRLSGLCPACAADNWEAGPDIFERYPECTDGVDDILEHKELIDELGNCPYCWQGKIEVKSGKEKA